MSLFSVRFGVRRSAAAALDGYDSPSSCSSSALLRDSSPQKLLVRRRGSKRQQFKSRTQSSSTTTATVLERSISMSGKKLNKMRSIVRHWKKLTQVSQSRYLSLADKNNNNGSNGSGREEPEKKKRSGSGDSCFFSSSSSLSDLECSPKSVKHLARSAVADDVPDGCLALFVGRERRRFVIGAHYLEHNLFRGLLERSAAEFGFDQKGGIMIACEVVLFEHLLWLIGTDDPSSRHLQVDELLDFYAY